MLSTEGPRRLQKYPQDAHQEEASLQQGTPEAFRRPVRRIYYIYRFSDTLSADLSAVYISIHKCTLEASEHSGHLGARATWAEATEPWKNQGKLRKTELRTPSGLPRGTQESSKATPRAPRSTPGGVRGCSGSSQERSRRVPGEPESAPRAPRELPRALRDRSESPKERSKSPNCCKSALE